MFRLPLVAIILFLSLFSIVSLLPKDKNKTNSAEDLEKFILKQGNCKQREGYNKCLEKNARELLARFSFHEISGAYENITNRNPVLSCHDILHHLASLNYEKNKNLAQSFSECSSVCFNACYHGVVLGYIDDMGLESASNERIAGTLRSVCNSLSGPKKFLQADCIHGIGHALMLTSDNNLPWALKSCDLARRPASCYEGVFMENFPGTSTSDHPSKYLRNDDPTYPCNAVDNKYRRTCFTFLASHFIFQKGWNLEAVLSSCLLIPSEYRSECYRTMGTSAMGKSNVTMGDLSSICESIPTENGRQECVRGVVISFYDRYSGVMDKFLGMFDFCEQAEDNYKKTCYTQIGKNLRGVILDPKKRETVCSKVLNEQERAWCLNPHIN